MKLRLPVAGLAAAALFCPASVQAGGQAGGQAGVSTGAAAPLPGDAFRVCDGYDPPKGKGDGITTGTMLFGLAAKERDIRRGVVNADSRKAIEACDAALADPLLLPAFTLRRAHLMQARAFHQVGAGAFDEALRAIDAVDALKGEFDPIYFERGLGLGNRLLRAYVLIETGRTGEAGALLDAIDDERAYAASVRRTTEVLRHRIDPDLGHQLARMRAMAPVVPSMALMAFKYAMLDGRIEQAVELGAGVSFAKPQMRGNWTAQNSDDSADREMQLEAMYAGFYAYALAASGKTREARAHLAAVRAGLDAAMAPPPPSPDGRPLSKSARNAFEMRAVLAKSGLEQMEGWEKIIALREEAPGLDLQGLLDRLKAAGPEAGVVLIDLVGQLGQASQADKRAIIEEIRARHKRERDREFATDLAHFAPMMPRAETEATQVRLGDSYFLTGEGFTLRGDKDDPGDWTVRFTHGLATLPTLEEHAMLAAATATKAKGYDAMLVQSQRGLERTLHVTGWGSRQDVNSGREAQMRVRMVHKAALPADIAGAQWRLLDADTVIADLATLPRR